MIDFNGASFTLGVDGVGRRNHAHQGGPCAQHDAKPEF